MREDLDRQRIWLDDVHDASKNLQGVEQSLRRLASAFYTTGNTHVADELNDMAEMIVQCDERTRLAINKDLSSQVDEGNQTLGKILWTLTNLKE